MAPKPGRSAPEGSKCSSVRTASPWRSRRTAPTWTMSPRPPGSRPKALVSSRGNSCGRAAPGARARLGSVPTFATRSGPHQLGAIVVVPIGFACDNMEVVYDLDIEAAAVAREKGVHFVRAATVSTTPSFVSMVRELVAERVAPFGPRRAEGTFGPWPDNCPDGHCPASAPTGSRMRSG